MTSGHFGLMPETKLTFAQLNSRGLIEIIDMKTGAVVAIQKDHRDVQNLPDAMSTHQLPDGTLVQLQKGIDPGAVVHSRAWPFSQITADIICQKVAAGGKIYKIFQEAGMPPYNIYLKWKREHPHFAKDLEEARKDRAEFMRDRALDLAEDATENDAQSSRLKVDTFKWAAGVDDQNRYSPKAKVEGTVSMPVQIVIATGIDRTPLPENNTREVTHADTNQTQTTPALPHGSRSAAPASGDHQGQGAELEVHPISGAPLK